MTDTNIVTTLLACAERHPDNKAVQSMATSLRTAVTTARLNKGEHDVGLSGYRAGTQGRDGYGPMTHLDASVLTSMMREMSALHKVGVIVDVMATALQALGEEIDH